MFQVCSGWQGDSLCLPLLFGTYRLRHSSAKLGVHILALDLVLSVWGYVFRHKYCIMLLRRGSMLAFVLGYKFSARGKEQKIDDDTTKYFLSM